MRRGGLGLLQVVGGQWCCVECIWILSRFVSFVRVDGSEAGGASTGGLERRQEKGAQLEVLAAGIADDAHAVARLLVDGQLAVEFVVPLANALGDAGEGLFKALADLFFKEVPLESAQTLNLFDGFVMPAAQGGAMHVKPGGDLIEGKAFGAEFDELVFGFEGVHS